MIMKVQEDSRDAAFRMAPWTSLGAQWLTVCLPMQGTRVQSLVWDDSTCLRTTKPPQLPNLSSRVPEPRLPKPLCPRAHALQQEKPATTMRSPGTVTSDTPAHHSYREKPLCTNEDPVQPKMEKKALRQSLV